MAACVIPIEGRDRWVAVAGLGAPGLARWRLALHEIVRHVFANERPPPAGPTR
jgi:hypothetical protein